MIKENSKIIQILSDFSYKPGINSIKGFISAYAAFPLSEIIEKRNISKKIKELRKYYDKDYSQRKIENRKRLCNLLDFSQANVPYYKDLFYKHKIDINKIKKDINYLNDIPYLNKDIIKEHKSRLLSKELSDIRYHHCKTGGSTGISCSLYYDQTAADYATAISIYTRECISKKKYHSELHFACRFPGQDVVTWPSRETLKCFAMNRSNIFFDRLDELGIQDILKILHTRNPYLVHAHPSTIYAVASFIRENKLLPPDIKIFESSGELLEKNTRRIIEKELNCKVINRYGSAEFGISAYEITSEEKMYLLDSEVYAESYSESESESELVLTGLRNKLMPLIRYRTGDLAEVFECDNGIVLKNMVGRIHDYIYIGGIKYATHYIQDIIDHRIGSIVQFQLDTRYDKPILKIVPEINADRKYIRDMAFHFWGHDLEVDFIGLEHLVMVGRRNKFRHIV